MNLKTPKANTKIKTALFFVVIAFVEYFVLSYAFHIPRNIAWKHTVFGLSFLYLLLWLFPFRIQFFLPPVIRYLLMALQSIIVAAIWIGIAQSLLLSYFPNDLYESFWTSSFWIRGLLAALIIFDYYTISFLLNKFRNEQKSIEKEQQLIRLNKDSELFKLRQQLQPHFLFNSLNSINALIGIEPVKAREMIQQLSDYLRNNLKKEEVSLLRFDEELTDLKLYLAIEKIRFGDRLFVEEKVELDCAPLLIPPFLLQPLIENAIKHGLYGTTGAVRIELNARLLKLKNSAELEFSVSNPYDPQFTDTKGTGFGLSSIKRRLYLLFSRNDLLRIEQIPETSYFNAQFIVTIKIPVNYVENNSN